MNTYIATVIKTGNSIALRVPKQYARDAHLTLGEKAALPLPIQQKQRQNHAKIKHIIKKLQKLHAYSSITDPLVWQRNLRKDRDFT